jgi:threonine aldolase
MTFWNDVPHRLYARGVAIPHVEVLTTCVRRALECEISIPMEVELVTALDLRSDTLTMPTPGMRRAMSRAPLGDDVFHEDPTVNTLEEMAAERMGKAAGLFISSGTMGNLLGLLVSASSGEEVIVDAQAHVFMSEGGGAAAIGGIQLRQIDTEVGVMTPEQISAAIRSTSPEFIQPRTAAIAVENTHNRHHGIAWPLPALQAAAASARGRGLKVHLDGARMFNAAVATSVDVREIANCADSLSFCLSKGLACPVGSVFVGTKEAISTARQWRKRLGGGMRQAGVIAAAGIYALDNLVERLSEDHANARRLAEGLAELSRLAVRLDLVQTNLVFVDVLALSAAAFVEECKSRGLRVLSTGGNRVRFVTYLGITSRDVERAVRIVNDVLRNATPAAPRRTEPVAVGAAS